MLPLINHYIGISKSLLRTPTYLLLCLYLLVGFLCGAYLLKIDSSALFSFFILIKFAGCLLIIALWYMNGTALNDYADYEIDLINLKNDKDRPLVSGAATKQELMNLAVAYALAAAGLALLISPWHMLCVIVLLLLNFAYSLKPLQISRRGGIAPLLLPLGYVALPFLLGYGLVGWELPKFALAILGALYLQFAGRIILKDYRDVKGDAAHNKRTFLLRHGNSAVCAISAACISASLLIIFSSFSNSVFRFSLLILTGYALTMLYTLSNTSKWTKQKPLLAAFGRSMTGVTVLLIFILVGSIWNLRQIEINITLAVILVVYIWSARQAFLFNTGRLARAGQSK